MHRTEPPLITLAVLLAALAGFVDALAFTSMGGFFASFMSGNSTRLGVGAASGDMTVAMMAGALVLSFLSGVILSSVITRAVPDRARVAVMSVVTMLLAVAAMIAGLTPGPIVLLLLAAAMGAENGVFTRDGEVSIGLTYMSGCLVRTGQHLASALMGEGERWAWVPWLLLWAGFVFGVMLGAGAQLRWGWTALWMAVAASAVLTLVLTRVPSGVKSV